VRPTKKESVRGALLVIQRMAGWVGTLDSSDAAMAILFSNVTLFIIKRRLL
jgi:hypothetical protein